MYKFVTLFCMSTLIVRCIFSEQLGGSCKIQVTDETGTCVLLQNCPGAVDALRTSGRRPQICGFQKTDAVICCSSPNVDIDHQTPSTTTIAGPVEGLKVISKSEEKCKQYSKYSGNVHLLPLISDSVEKVIPDCSIYTIPLIVGGYQDPIRYPHMALIGFVGLRNTTEWVCSGSLISEDFVLTAAHCLQSRAYDKLKFIRLGDIRKHANTAFQFVQDFTVVESITHPGYKPPSKYNDIGLLKMNKKAIFNKGIRPICLPISLKDYSEQADVTSWSGVVGPTNSEDERYLIQYKVESVSEADCNAAFMDVLGRRLRNGIMNDMQMCVKARGDPLDTFDDTSGGSLQVLNKNVHCSYSIIGISSFGSSYVRPDMPKVYTKVLPYSKWIEDTVFSSE